MCVGQEKQEENRERIFHLLRVELCKKQLEEGHTVHSAVVCMCFLEIKGQEQDKTRDGDPFQELAVCE